MAKLYADDLPAVMAALALKIRTGARLIRDNNVLLVREPGSIHFEGEAIIRLNDILRTEVTSKDGTVTTTTEENSVETEEHSAPVQITDESEFSSGIRNSVEDSIDASSEQSLSEEVGGSIEASVTNEKGNSFRTGVENSLDETIEAAFTLHGGQDTTDEQSFETGTVTGLDSGSTGSSGSNVTTYVYEDL